MPTILQLYISILISTLSEEKINEKTKVRQAVLSVILVASVLISCIILTSCGNPNDELVNEWICEKVVDGYPDIMTLYSDGTCIADNVNCTWKTEGDQLIISDVYRAESYTYQLENNDDDLRLLLNGKSYHIRKDGETVPKQAYQLVK